MSGAMFNSIGACDAMETQDAVYYKVDVPGLSKSDIKVRLHDGSLTVSGDRPVEPLMHDARTMRHERHFGPFTRVFKLPDGLDISKTAAACDHGVLTISIPKLAPSVPQPGQTIAIVSGEEEGDGSLNSQFQAVSVSVFPKPSIGQLVIINSDTPIVDAVKTLSQFRILAAPVRDVTKPDTAPWTEKYLGIVDMTDVVFYMLDKLQPVGGTGTPEDLEREMSSIEEFKKTTVKQIADVTRMGPFVPIDESNGTLLDAMLLCGNHAVRRVPVVHTPGGDIVNIITQSALVQTLYANLERFVSVSNATLGTLGLANPARVHSVTTEDTLRAAFQLIRDHNVSAVPVVDSVTGVIRGNISARDARLLVGSAKVYKLLNMPIKAYLDIVTDGAENSAITVTADDTLEEVIKRMVRSRIHRVYVVDSRQHLVRVVSLRNVLRKFVKEPVGYFGHYFEY